MICSGVLSPSSLRALMRQNRHHHHQQQQQQVEEEEEEECKHSTDPLKSPYNPPHPPPPPAGWMVPDDAHLENESWGIDDGQVGAEGKPVCRWVDGFEGLQRLFTHPTRAGATREGFESGRFESSQGKKSFVESPLLCPHGRLASRRPER